MSSPIDEAKDVNPALPAATGASPALLYAPQWARDQAQPPTDAGPAPPIEWPPRGRRLDNVRIFDERAALEARRELALQPEKVPEPPQPDPGDQIKTVLRICGVAGAAAVVAWTLVSTLDAGSPRHEPTRTSSTARPVAVAPAKSNSPPVALAARSDGNSGGSNGDEVGQESREVSREESRQVSPQESREEPQKIASRAAQGGNFRRAGGSRRQHRRGRSGTGNRARSAKGGAHAAQPDHPADGPR